jgi:phosphoglycerol transferase MdoB-like AlkP superfamily enzyme
MPASTRHAIRKSFLLVVFMEVVGLLLVWILANRLQRPDLATDWCAMVVGLHFLPLAKIFRARHLGVIGILMTLWCVLCWSLFRSNALVISVTVGTGILLWAASVSALFRARTIMHSLQ